MTKKAKIVHYCLLAAGWLCLVWQLVFFLAHWSSLPDECGVHFAPTGEFDVIAYKAYGFYPHIISFVIMTVDLIVSTVIVKEKLKLGLKVKERGRQLILSSFVVTLDIISLGITVIFCFWTFAVSTQQPSVMDHPASVVIRGLSLLLLAAVIFQCSVNAVYKERPDGKELSADEKRRSRIRFLLTGSSGNTESGISHRLSRIVSWLIIVILTAIILFCLERLPLDDIADEHHGKAYFSNFGGYYDKWLIFLPVIAAAPLMLICEIISVRANKKGNTALVSCCGRLRLTLAVFSGWWLLELGSELAVGPLSVILFAAACVFSIAVYIINKRSENKAGK